MMKRIMFLLMMAALVAAAQAVVVTDDFESYLTGQANVAADTGGVWTGLPDWTGNPEIATDGSNQWLRNYGAGRGARADISPVSSGIVTLDFDMSADTTWTDTSFGLAELGGNALNWDDYTAYAAMVGVSDGLGGRLLEFRARNSATNVTLGTVNVGQWYHVQIVADVVAGLYDVFLDGGLVADDFAFRADKTNVTVDALKMYSNAGTLNPPGEWVNIDNVAVVPEPATMALLGLGAVAVFRKRK